MNEKNKKRVKGIIGFFMSWFIIVFIYILNVITGTFVMMNIPITIRIAFFICWLPMLIVGSWWMHSWLFEENKKELY